MKRDWDTIREILIALEEKEGPSPMTLSDFPDKKSDEISYHLELLIEAGLVDGKVRKYVTGEPNEFIASRLTWKGHEFLDSVRSDTVWQRTKKSFVANGIGMTFDVIKSVASDFAVSSIRSSM